MWFYQQSTGLFFRSPIRQLPNLSPTIFPISAPVVISVEFSNGYAGRGVGLNNPAEQATKNVGPLPCGLYRMEAPVDTSSHGNYVIWLTPDPKNQMFGRFGFGLHDDNRKGDHSGSSGCICCARAARERAWLSGDHELEVVP